MGSYIREMVACGIMIHLEVKKLKNKVQDLQQNDFAGARIYIYQ